MVDKPKILIIDIETRPATAYVWKMFDENISLDQLIDPGSIICFAYKWHGSPEVRLYSVWEHGYREMIAKAHELISEADAIVTYNGDKFDLPKLTGAFLEQRLPPPPPVTSIDLYKSVKKLGLLSNRLAFVGPFFKIGTKIKNAGFPLWRDTMAGLPSAQAKMGRYCKQDVRLLDQVYKFVRPYIRNHPHLDVSGRAGTCGACGSSHVQRRGYRRTRLFKIQRLQCQDCGSWSDGKRTKIV